MLPSSPLTEWICRRHGGCAAWPLAASWSVAPAQPHEGWNRLCALPCGRGPQSGPRRAAQPPAEVLWPVVSIYRTGGRNAHRPRCVTRRSLLIQGGLRHSGPRSAGPQRGRLGIWAGRGIISRAPCFRQGHGHGGRAGAALSCGSLLPSIPFPPPAPACAVCTAAHSAQSSVHNARWRTAHRTAQCTARTTPPSARLHPPSAVSHRARCPGCRRPDANLPATPGLGLLARQVVLGPWEHDAARAGHLGVLGSRRADMGIALPASCL